MKIKNYFCLLITLVISVTTATLSVRASYFDGTGEATIGDFRYILNYDIQYGSVKIPYSATVTDIPNIKKVEIPEKVTYNGTEFTVTDLDLDDVDNSMINKNSKIEEIVLPDSIYNIHYFHGFGNLKKINIPKNTVIGREPNNYYVGSFVYTNLGFNDLSHMSYFEYCPKLRLSVNPNNPYYSYKNDMLFSKDEKKIYMSFNRNTDIIIPDGVEEIFNYGGIGFKHVKNVKFPNSLKYLWADCGSLTNVSLPNGLEILGGTFEGSEFDKIVIPNSVTDIHVSTFKGTKLTKITIPDNVKKIWDSAFASSAIKSVKFGKGLKTIGPKSFARCSNLKSVTIPKDLKNLDSWAFKACKKLESVKILSDNVKLGSRAFEKCPKLKKVSINKAKSISYHIFSRCLSLKTVEIKETSKIERGAFYNCKKLSKVKIGNKKKAPKIEKRAFKNTKSGIKFYVKNKKVAKSLRKQLKGSGVRNAKILVSKSCV